MGYVFLCVINMLKKEGKKAKRRLEDIALGGLIMEYELIGGISAGKATARWCGVWFINNRLHKKL